MYFISKERTDELFRAISSDRALYIPSCTKSGKAEFTRYTDGVTYCDSANTERSAKDFFFPQTENLAKFKKEGAELQVIDCRSECEDFVLFGVRACDMASFDILDSVYLSEPVDTFYQNRREHCTVMTVKCSSPAETCFCRTFGIDPVGECGDVSCAVTETGIYLTAVTEKGAALISGFSDILTESAEDGAKAQSERCVEILDKMPLSSLSVENFGGDRLNEYFSSDKWEGLSEACLGCGSCTFVCPTCQCYDIRDFDTGHGVVRFRCWDSCMYSDFTKMAHGNPRTTQLERFRQRFMHKLVYYPANNNGKFGCVGCGRCLRKCPVSMNIVKVMKALSK